MENTSISSNITYWKEKVIDTEFTIIAIQTNLNLSCQHKNQFPSDIAREQRLISQIRNLNYELKEMKKNLNFWLWVNKNFGEGYEETFSYPTEDDE